jgi:hypothetical protein
MLENAAMLTHRGQGGSEASVVVALDPANTSRRPTMPIPAPPLARRMRYHGMRPRILARIAFDVPRVHVRQAVIATVALDVESGDYHFVLKNL